jgi:UDP-galactopyranose mutase
VYDFLVVGAGFTGSVLAERLAFCGHRVLVADVRPHVGGNAYDHEDGHGILIHKYGPHIFHTNSPYVYAYLSRFTRWRPYEHRVLAAVRGKLLPIPINLDTVNGLYGWDLTSEELAQFFESIGEKREIVRTSEDAVVSKVGRELYELFFRNYTRKQWGLDPSELDASVVSRIPIRTDRDNRYFTDRFQVMPRDGYTAIFEAMLDHENIDVALGESFEQLRARFAHRAVIYTGPIDAYFDCCFGRLPYRSLEFQHVTYEVPRFQSAAVVNYPNENPYTRITEFKFLTGQRHGKTSVVYEIPRAEGDAYYPIPRAENAALYRRYAELAARTSNVFFAGRLGTYKYYNMDQCVAQALALAAKITGEPRGDLTTRVTA